MFKNASESVDKSREIAIKHVKWAKNINISINKYRGIYEK